MKWLRIVLKIVEYAIPFLGAMRNAKKLKQATDIADTVMIAVDKAGAKTVKEAVTAMAKDKGIQDIVHKWVKTRIEPKVKDKLGL